MNLKVLRVLSLALILTVALPCSSYATRVEQGYNGGVPNPPKQYLPAMHRVFGYGYGFRMVECIAWYESRYHPRAVSATGDYGFMQINYVAWHTTFNWNRIFELRYNLHAAKVILRQQGWGAWRTLHYCRSVR